MATWPIWYEIEISGSYQKPSISLVVSISLSLSTLSTDPPKFKRKRFSLIIHINRPNPYLERIDSLHHKVGFRMATICSTLKVLWPQKGPQTLLKSTLGLTPFHHGPHPHLSSPPFQWQTGITFHHFSGHFNYLKIT